MSSSVESIVDRRRELGLDLLDDGRAPRGGPSRWMRSRIAVGVLRLDLGGQLGVEPLRLAGLAAELLLRLAELPDLGVRELERLEQRVLGDLVGARLDHRQAVLRADDDQVELAALARSPAASG